MMKIKNLILYSIFLLLIFNLSAYSQFGQNKVQYKKFKYQFIQSEHFDVYFTEGSERLATFAAVVAESALVSITRTLKYNINNRLKIIVYNSHGEFQQTNVIQEFLSEGIGGVTELFKNRIVLPFEGSYSQFRHVLHHELVHAVMNDLFYGGSIQNVISNNITLSIPLWFIEGMAEFESLGWDVNSDMFLRDALINESLPDIMYLDGYFAYRGGQSVLWFIERKYGREKLAELVSKIRGTGNFESGLKNTIGIGTKELNEIWKKDQKLLYWPDIAKYKEPTDFARQLTDHQKDGGFFNSSPAISPQGDRIAFISNRDDYFDVYIMSATDGKIIKKLVKGNTTNDFEELNILTPGLTWSPDGKKIALSAKAGGEDAIYIIDVESGKEKKLTFGISSIFSVGWSPKGDKLVFSGLKNLQSDLYLYDLNTNTLTRILNDIFHDTKPVFSSDGKKIFFISERMEYTDINSTFGVQELLDKKSAKYEVYCVDIETRTLSRVTDLESSNEIDVASLKDNKGILFISDINGISNLYYADLVYEDSSTNKLKPITKDDLKPITNSLNGIYQFSLSDDDKKLAFATIYKSAYNIFIINNPLENVNKIKPLEPTYYITSLRKEKKEISDTLDKNVNTIIQPNKDEEIYIATGNITDSSKAYNKTSRTDFSNYIFGEKFKEKDERTSDSLQIVTDGKDENGNFKVYNYKISFSPDLVYANAGYSTFYGFLGSAILAFSDLMGDHQIIAQTSLQIDLKNSDYALAYFYLPERTDFMIQGYHTARFLALNKGLFSYIYRFRNYGVSVAASYPIDRFYRIDGGLSWTNLSKENLEIIEEPTEITQLLIPSLNFVHDNSLWGFTAPVRGTRYNLSIFGVPPLSKDAFSFGTLTADYRTYFKFWTDYSFAFRLSGGISFGRNPQKFMLGGLENWINREFQENRIPINSVEDFLFLTPVFPMRGYNYAQQLGSKYGLVNLELRFPLIKFLVTGPLPILFQNIQGNLFVDVGSAWTDNKSYKGIKRDPKTGDLIAQDLLMGTGLGTRIYFMYFLIKFDVAWSYDIKGFSMPKYYFSLGTDF